MSRSSKIQQSNSSIQKKYLNDAINEFDKVNGRKESLLPDERPVEGILF